MQISKGLESERNTLDIGNFHVGNGFFLGGLVRNSSFGSIGSPLNLVDQ
jgi:hypothetical protein